MSSESSENVTMTRKHFVLAQRLASAKARCAALFAARTEGLHHQISDRHDGFLREKNPCESCIEEARLRYPLPRVTRPRVVTDARFGKAREFRICDGQFQTRSAKNSVWSCIENGHHGKGDGFGLAIDAERVTLWADLLANPTEEVDAE